MRTLGIVVQWVLEVASFLVGGLILVVGIVLALHAVARPECSVDPDDARAVLVDRVSVGVWVAGQAAWLIVVGKAFARSTGGWSRVPIAAALPAGLVVVWAAFGAANKALLDLVDASGAAASCW